MAIAQYYVDPSIAADSGAGTSGDPYGDLQYALDNITQGTADGDQINIKAGTDEVLTAALDLTTYGTPAAEYPLYFRGYTSSANDGGVGTINCDGNTMFASDYDYVALFDLDINGNGCANIVELDTGAHVINCTIYGCTGNAIDVGVQSVIIANHIYDCDTYGITAGFSYIAFNVVSSMSSLGANSTAGYFLNAGATAQGNLFRTSDAAGGTGFSTNANDITIINNTAVSTGACTGVGFDIGASDYGIIAINNYAEGFSGAGAYGFILRANSSCTLFANNYAYNNTTNFSKLSVIVEDTGNTELSASGLVDPANGDFRANNLLRALGWPATFPEVDLTNYLDIGAVQRREVGHLARAAIHGV